MKIPFKSGSFLSHITKILQKYQTNPSQTSLWKSPQNKRPFSVPYHWILSILQSSFLNCGEHDGQLYHQTLKSTHNKMECKYGLSVRTYFHTHPQSSQQFIIKVKDSLDFWPRLQRSARCTFEVQCNVPYHWILSIHQISFLYCGEHDGQLHHQTVRFMQ